MSKKIYDEEGILVAILISQSDVFTETTFLTNSSEELQIGFIETNKTRGIPKHYHPSVSRTLNKTSEFVQVRQGSCNVKIYDDKLTFISNEILHSGDSLLLLRGAHEFEGLTEKLSLLEIKQGPYVGKRDKVLL